MFWVMNFGQCSFLIRVAIDWIILWTYNSVREIVLMEQLPIIVISHGCVDDLCSCG